MHLGFVFTKLNLEINYFNSYQDYMLLSGSFKCSLISFLHWLQHTHHKEQPATYSRVKRLCHVSCGFGGSFPMSETMTLMMLLWCHSLGFETFFFNRKPLRCGIWKKLQCRRMGNVKPSVFFLSYISQQVTKSQDISSVLNIILLSVSCDDSIFMKCPFN